MYIENFRSPQKGLPDKRAQAEPEKRQASAPAKAGDPKEGEIEKHPYDTLIHWKAPEFELIERDRKWLRWITVFLAAMVGYALITNSLIMAITFILVGIVGYMHLGREPRILTFRITPDGVAAGRELYRFSNIHSFWIFYEPEGKKVISLHMDSYLAPFVHIPIHEEDPVAIRDVLVRYADEVKQEPGLVDTFERFLGI